MDGSIAECTAISGTFSFSAPPLPRKCISPVRALSSQEWVSMPSDYVQPGAKESMCMIIW